MDQINTPPPTTRPASKDPESIIAEIEALKTAGNDFFRAGKGAKAGEKWSTALLKISHFLSSPEGKQQCSIGGKEFLNILSQFRFRLNSNLTQNTINSIRQNFEKGDMDSVDRLFGVFKQQVEDARNAVLPGANWKPDDMEYGKLLYREAVGYRLVGRLEMAEKVIDIAQRDFLPNDENVRREKGKIERAKRFGTAEVFEWGGVV